ncbi:MAG: hypothetical protein B7X79_12590 [Acidovorax sp. 17-64-282]|nr:MAG: hypothetical protein B7X79_12590 [Acidovorax sp. 17-64-282]
MLIAFNALAAPPDIKLLPDTSKLRPSKLPGYAIAMQKCAIYEVKQVGAYLSAAYGSAKATDASVIAASTPAPAPPAPPTSPGAAAAPPAGGASVNVQALLASNACLSCHGLTQKIVGPGYHDVAEKYKADPQAQSKLEASIRGGSVGKWGSVPMPPFAALKPEEVKALAAFVLKQ